MSAALAISKREIRTYFNSPVAYIVVTAYMLVAGFIFFDQLFLQKQADMRGYFGVTPWLFPIFISAITMRLMAEEKGSGTLELLITMPVRDFEVVLGKFLAAVTMVAAMVFMTSLYAISVNALGDLDSGPTIGGYLGMLLMGSAYAAIGLMASSLTKNQIVAFIIAFALCFSLFLSGHFARSMPDFMRQFMVFVSTGEHFNAIARGVIDLRDVLYFFSVIVICLVIATTSLDSRRWS